MTDIETDDTDELRAEIERLSRELASERARTTELENKVEALESQSTESDESAESDESGSKETPMHQLIEAGEAAVIGHVTPSIRRAKAIAENFPKWAKKTPSGFVIRDGLKNLVETATGESLFHKQIERACNALAKFTNGAIAFKNHRKHGWMLIAQPDDCRYRSLSAAGG